MPPTYGDGDSWTPPANSWTPLANGGHPTLVATSSLSLTRWTTSSRPGLHGALGDVERRVERALKRDRLQKAYATGRCFYHEIRVKRFKLCNIQEANYVSRVNSALRFHIDLFFLSFPFLSPSYNAIVTSGLAEVTNQTCAELRGPSSPPSFGIDGRRWLIHTVPLSGHNIPW